MEVVFLNELLGNVSKLNLDIFMTLLKFSIKSLVTKKPIIGIGGHIVKKHGHIILGGFYCLCLLGSNGIEGNKEFIVNRSSIEKESAHNHLNLENPFFIKFWTGGLDVGILLFGAIFDFAVLVGR